MKKKFIGVTIIAVIVAVASWNMTQNKKVDVMLSELALSNIEALAQYESMTPEEFYEKTGCYAKPCQQTCNGKDGKTHESASKDKTCNCEICTKPLKKRLLNNYYLEYNKNFKEGVSKALKVRNYPRYNIL